MSACGVCGGRARVRHRAYVFAGTTGKLAPTLACASCFKDALHVVFVLGPLQLKTGRAAPRAKRAPRAARWLT